MGGVGLSISSSRASDAVTPLPIAGFISGGMAPVAGHAVAEADEDGAEPHGGEHLPVVRVADFPARHLGVVVDHLVAGGESLEAWGVELVERHAVDMSHQPTSASVGDNAQASQSTTAAGR